MDVLDYIGQFTTQKNRKEAAIQLAKMLKGEDLIIFIPDYQLNLLLPGPGFSQSLPNGKAWNRFLISSRQEVYRGVVPYPAPDTIVPALAIRGVDGSVAVLIGGAPTQKETKLLQKVLPIVTPLLREEQALQAIQSQAIYHAQATQKAERLTTTLEGIRHDLMKTLAENARLLKLTKQQNDELAAANEEIRANVEELQRTNADLENFIYTASHDLKSPISSIEGLVKILAKKLQKKGWEDETIKEILQFINDSVYRFKETITDLTQIAKIGKEAEGQSQHVNLREVINDVMLDLHSLIQESQAHITCEVSESISITFSRKNLKSIVYNLLANAIKYCDLTRQPTIIISCVESVDYFILSVTDNGLGVDTSDESKIFGLYQRMHDHVEGSGIGLYMVKKIIETSRGKIEVESIVGEGSTFRVHFLK